MPRRSSTYERRALRRASNGTARVPRVVILPDDPALSPKATRRRAIEGMPRVRHAASDAARAEADASVLGASAVWIELAPRAVA